ncbi:MAG: FtsQ-type POTRA domain-containing protein [Chlorobiaceae bacterium]
MSDSEYHEYPGALPDGEEVPRDVVPLSVGGNRFVPLYIFLIVLAILAGLVSVASRWKKEVVVRDFVIDGVSIIADKELLSRIMIFKGRNLQELDAEELKQKIMVLPYLREAVITKELNGSVRVRVTEREPVAITFIDGRKTVIDREGFLLPWKPVVAERFPKLLEISGISRLKTAGNDLQQLDMHDVVLILHFLEALAETEYASILVCELHLSGNNMTWYTAVQPPTRFIVGNDGNFKEKLKKFEIFWQKVISKKGFGCYDTVDLRFRDRIFTTVLVPPKVPQSISQ